MVPTLGSGPVTLASPKVGVGGGAIVAEARDEEGLSINNDNPLRLDVMDAIESGYLLRSGKVEAIRKRDLRASDAISGIS